MKKPTYFAFRTHLSPHRFIERLPQELIEYNSLHDEWLRCEFPGKDPDRFRIGVRRIGHSDGGYWYCATMQKVADGTQITGKIVFNPDEKDDKRKRLLRDWIDEAVTWILFGIPALIIAAGVHIYLFIRRIVKHSPPSLTKEETLVDFMTSRMSCQLTEQR